jgi:hypothetical protein
MHETQHHEWGLVRKGLQTNHLGIFNKTFLSFCQWASGGCIRTYTLVIIVILPTGLALAYTFRKPNSNVSPPEISSAAFLPFI